MTFFELNKLLSEFPLLISSTFAFLVPQKSKELSSQRWKPSWTEKASG